MMPLQIILSPLFIFIAFVALLCFFYVPIYPFLKVLIQALGTITSFIKPLSFGINMPSFNHALLIFYFAFYLGYLIYLSKGFVPLYRTILLIQLTTIVIYALPIKNSVSNEVNFINVGQGDCTLIRNKNKTVLIDTGGLTYMDVANESLVPYLRKKRIYKIDAVIITHYDDDHCGALSSLMKSYSVKAVYDYNCVMDADYDQYSAAQENGTEGDLVVKDMAFAGVTRWGFEKRFHTDGTVDEPEDLLAEIGEISAEIGQLIEKAQAGEAVDMEAFLDTLKAKYPNYAYLFDMYITLYQTYGAEGLAAMMTSAD